MYISFLYLWHFKKSFTGTYTNCGSSVLDRGNTTESLIDRIWKGPLEITHICSTDAVLQGFSYLCSAPSWKASSSSENDLRLLLALTAAFLFILCLLSDHQPFVWVLGEVQDLSVVLEWDLKAETAFILITVLYRGCENDRDSFKACLVLHHG